MPHALEIRESDSPKVLTFHINLHTPGAVDQAGFVHYLGERFDGRTAVKGRYAVPPHYVFGLVESEFPSEQAAKDVQAFCSDSLSSSGLPKREARHLVHHNDFRDHKAIRLMQEIYEFPIEQRQ